MLIKIPQLELPVGIKLKDGRQLSSWDFRTEKQLFDLTILTEKPGPDAFKQINLFEIGSLSDPFYANNIIVNGYQTYAQLYNQVNNNAILIDHIRMIVPDRSYFDYPLSITYYNVNGRTMQYPIFPNLSIDTDQHQNLLVDIDLKDEPILVSGNTIIGYEMRTADNLKIRLIMSYSKMIMKSDALNAYNNLTKL